MKKKNSLILDDEFLLYCQLNNIDNTEKLAKETFNRGFALLKYGETPVSIKGKEKIIEKEVIKEVVVEKQLPPEIRYVEKEVPVERIVEKPIEVIKEIPVEKIVVKEVIKEVPVDKIVYVTDQQELNEKIFQKDQEIQDLLKNFSIKEQELENNFQKEKDDLLSKIKDLENRPPNIIEKEVIKEVVKEVNNLDELQKLADENTKLKTELDGIKSSLDRLNKGRFLKNSDLSSLYDE